MGLVSAECVRACYDSAGCKYFERGKIYQIDPYAYGKKNGNGLIKHFRLINEMPPEEAEEKEKEAEKQEEARARARKASRARAQAAEAAR